MTWLVVGGDGLIGRRVAVDARSIAGSVVTSSRRPGPHSGQVFADLATGNVSAVTAVGAEVVFLCAAMTNMQACRDSPELTYRVNVTETVKLASQLVKQGAFVVFLSSNTVFNGLVSMPDEDEPAEPVTEYRAPASKLRSCAFPRCSRRHWVWRLNFFDAFERARPARLLTT